MKSAAIVVSETYQKNRLFDPHSPLNRDDCLAPLRELQKGLAVRGFDLQTSDLHSPGGSDLVIYSEMPKILPEASALEKSYLVLSENEIICPDNWVVEKHRFFKKIFTWNDSFVDGKRYFKIHHPMNVQAASHRNAFSERKLACVISGNKSCTHPMELYSKRIEIIRWFEKNHPEEFDLYGMGWSEYRFSGPKLIRALNRIKPLTRMLAPSFPSYRGPVQNKIDCLSRYRFNFCFENARDITGYISEKIFDAFSGGAVPIYWGAPNILDHVPAGCFIDYRQFKSVDELYHYLISVDLKRYEIYLGEIDRFLKTKGLEYSPRAFAERIISQIL